MHNKIAFMHDENMKVKETPLKPSYMCIIRYIKTFLIKILFFTPEHDVLVTVYLVCFLLHCNEVFFFHAII